MRARPLGKFVSVRMTATTAICRSSNNAVSSSEQTSAVFTEESVPMALVGTRSPRDKSSAPMYDRELVGQMVGRARADGPRSPGRMRGRVSLRDTVAEGANRPSIFPASQVGTERAWLDGLAIRVEVPDCMEVVLPAPRTPRTCRRCDGQPAACAAEILADREYQISIERARHHYFCWTL